MIKVWDYQDANIIKITAIDGQVFTGRLIEVTDVEDESPDYGYKEDSITIEAEGREISFPQSEILSIEILD